jgi:hypothetical protein
MIRRRVVLIWSTSMCVSLQANIEVKVPSSIQRGSRILIGRNAGSRYARRCQHPSMTPSWYAAPPFAWKCPQTSNVELRALPASQPSPPASIHSSAKAKETDPTHSQRSSPTSLRTPGRIIPEWWARINRNAGRQLIGIGGRHHLGIGGRLAPEFAVVGNDEELPTPDNL